MQIPGQAPTPGMGPEQIPEEQDPTESFMNARSVFNPSDVAMMAQAGELTQETTIEEYLGMMGLTPQSTLAELSAVSQKQMQNADPVGKMRALAGRGGQPSAPPAPAGQPLAGGEPGVEDLLKQIP